MVQPWFPKHNVAQETKDWANKIQAMSLELKALTGEHSRLIKMLLGQNNTGARQVASVATQVSGMAGSGVPAGGYRGSVLARNAIGDLTWTTPVGAIVPRYEIYLEQDASDYTVNAYGLFSDPETAKQMLPVPTFAYDSGTGEVSLTWPPSWADEAGAGLATMVSDPMPVQLDIFLTAHSEGQVFNITLPAAWQGSGGAPWYTVGVYNEAAGDYNADVRLTADALVYEGGVERPDDVALAPGEYFVWRVDNHYFEGVGNVRPFWAAALHDGNEVGHPLDAYFWKHVRSVENHQVVFEGGALSAAPLGQTFSNGTETSYRVGKVTARVGSAPAGAAIEVQVLLNGITPIFATPVTIPAGESYGEGVPNAGGVSFKFWPKDGDDLILLYPGDFLTVDVEQVGSSIPGSDLTVQVYFG